MRCHWPMVLILAGPFYGCCIVHVETTTVSGALITSFAQTPVAPAHAANSTATVALLATSAEASSKSSSATKADAVELNETTTAGKDAFYTGASKEPVKQSSTIVNQESTTSMSQSSVVNVTRETGTSTPHAEEKQPDQLTSPLFDWQGTYATTSTSSIIWTQGFTVKFPTINTESLTESTAPTAAPILTTTEASTFATQLPTSTMETSTPHTKARQNDQSRSPFVSWPGTYTTESTYSTIYPSSTVKFPTINTESPIITTASTAPTPGLPLTTTEASTFVTQSPSSTMKISTPSTKAEQIDQSTSPFVSWPGTYTTESTYSTIWTQASTVKFPTINTESPTFTMESQAVTSESSSLPADTGSSTDPVKITSQPHEEERNNTSTPTFTFHPIKETTKPPPDSWLVLEIIVAIALASAATLLLISLLLLWCCCGCRKQNSATVQEQSQSFRKRQKSADSMKNAVKLRKLKAVDSKLLLETSQYANAPSQGDEPCVAKEVDESIPSVKSYPSMKKTRGKLAHDKTTLPLTIKMQLCGPSAASATVATGRTGLSLVYSSPTSLVAEQSYSSEAGTDVTSAATNSESSTVVSQVLKSTPTDKSALSHSDMVERTDSGRKSDNLSFTYVTQQQGSHTHQQQLKEVPRNRSTYSNVR